MFQHHAPVLTRNGTRPSSMMPTLAVIALRAMAMKLMLTKRHDVRNQFVDDHVQRTHRHDAQTSMNSRCL